jgi:hypothetical protein
MLDITLIPLKQIVCAGCKKHADKVYQYHYCRDCLNKTFKRLVKIQNEARGC